MANTANNTKGNFYNNMSAYVDSKAKKDDAVKAMLPDVLQYADKDLQQKALKGESATIYKDVIDNAMTNLPESIDNQLTQASFDKFDQRSKDQETVGLGVVGDKYVDVAEDLENQFKGKNLFNIALKPHNLSVGGKQSKQVTLSYPIKHPSTQSDYKEKLDMGPAGFEPATIWL